MIPVPLLNPKFATMVAAWCVRASGSGHWHAAKFARQKLPGGTLLAIPAGPTGNKIPVISKASRRANSGMQIAKRIWATDLGGRFGRRACVPPERA
jgi:hypothetical protein